MAFINVKIDGNSLEVERGITILEAARRAGITIPTLCHVEGKTADTPCGLCVVEVAGEAEPVRACTTKARSGMAVTTSSKVLTALRQERLSLLCETHFGDCKAPCNLTCPGQINVQGYIAHVAKGQYIEGLRLVMERNPLPFSVGRVCPRFCETRCRRILVDEPVSINHLKRFVADWCMTHEIELDFERQPATGKKIAVLGGGPTGLTGAYYLALAGHDVTIFEKNPKLGGMLRYGHQEYRVPKKVLDYEIDMILRLGISVRLNQRWGKHFTLRGLHNDGFDAIFAATGAGVPEPLEIPGATLPGVMSATRLLRTTAEGKRPEVGSRAAVIGGNNIALEAARTLIRLGAKEVTVIYPRARVEMPANQRLIREVEREGGQFLLMASPVQIMPAATAGLSLELMRMRLGEPDDKGIRQPVAIPGSANRLQVDTVIHSLGQMAVRDKLTGTDLEEQLELSPKNTIVSNPRTFQTNLEGVFAAGDAVSGTRTVIQSVVAARRAAENIHAYVMNGAREAAESRFNFTRGRSFDEVDLKNFEGIDVKLREKNPARPPEICTQDFDEVRLGFTETMARKEANRCLSCGCTAFDRCDLKRLAIDHNINLNKTGMGLTPHYAMDLSHPVIAVDLNKCIYCRRCANSCEYSALDLTASSFDPQGRPVGISLKFNEKCVSCGKCVDNCSTGALNKKDQIVPVVGERVRDVRTTCPYCGAGCQIVLKVKGNTIMQVTADPEQAPNFGALCVKGRFGFNFVEHPERLTKPMVRRHGQLAEVSWDEALETVAKRLFDIKAMYGPDSIAAFSCARATNEENFLMQKFMRAVVGTNNIDHCARL